MLFSEEHQNKNNYYTENLQSFKHIIESDAERKQIQVSQYSSFIDRENKISNFVYRLYKLSQTSKTKFSEFRQKISETKNKFCYGKILQVLSIVRKQKSIC